MDIHRKLYNSKLLLFGEYGLMFGAMALSVPFSRFHGSLEYDNDHTFPESTAEIRKFYLYLSSLESNRLHFPFDLQSLKQDLDKGLYFHSNIPRQYGLGSSGALVAALFSRYALPYADENSPPATLLKEDFALLESHFHGQSSGLDPLTSFLNQPILLDSNKQVQTLSLNLTHTGWAFAMIDTQATGATGPLVRHFIESLQQPVFKSVFESAFIPSSNNCIQSLLKRDHPAFFHSLEQLIHFELQYFRQMIPHQFNELIPDALNHQVFIKLLGSGGGGYLLAIAPRENILREWADQQGIPLLKVG
ncbi:MAG TPA: hypothetical protein VFG54_18610 [Prolixibacteraceae bacterium]|nr:hypothetical protein [Prolixibacteraceae bacterium]